MRLARIFFVNLAIVAFVSSVFFSQSIFAELSDSVQTPSLLTNPLIRSTSELLKQGIWGSCTVEVEIDSTGSVDSFSVSPSGNLSFDTLVRSKIIAARFSPALENGHAVPSVIQFEIAVPKDSLLAQCLQLPPVFTGTVIDTSEKVPLSGARIIVYYTDTTEDSSITIGFSNYLSIIGNLDGLKYNGKIISTITDSLGRFSFKLLPAGHITISVQSKGYGIGQFRGFIDKSKPLDSQFILDALQFSDST